MEQVTITRQELPNGKYRYEVDGKVHTAKSNRLYTHASVYQHEILDAWDIECGRKVGDRIVYLHAREDLALEGHRLANKIAARGVWSRVRPLAVEIQEV